MKTCKAGQLAFFYATNESWGWKSEGRGTAARTAFSRPIHYLYDPLASPQPSGRACFRAARDCSPPPRGRLRAAAASLKPQIQDSKLNKIAVARLSLFSIRAAACGARARSGPLGSELRASAAGRLRPADRCAIELTGKTHQQGPAVTGCGGSIRSCKINNRAQPAEGAHKAAASQAAVRFSFGICAYRIRGFCTIRSTSETT